MFLDASAIIAMLGDEAEGDCFAYAAAKAHDAPLLHKDEGFWLTDAKQARERG